EVSQRYQGDAEFRRTVDRFLADFEAIVRDMEQKDPSGRAVQAHLISDSGRVYLVLAQARGRLLLGYSPSMAWGLARRPDRFGSR
ncbi:hypothetical protein, partial [Klebsiella pneumoniae]|uniref:hypothetical protein n=1 Tax=Klebsiella pneumoniae TaxID=573 RepID=UPI00385483E9